MSFELLSEEVNKGIEGRNTGIPMGFKRLNKYVGIRRRLMHLIAGATGSGKSALLHSAYILHPFDFLLEHPENKTKFKVMLFSMERSKVYVLAKWICRRIFLKHGVLIPIQKLLGWWDDNKLTHDEHDLFLSTKDYIDNLLSVVEIIEGAQNPTGIYKHVKEYAENHGKLIPHTNKLSSVYIPNNENEIVIIAIDHLGLTKTERGYMKKEAIDKLSEYCQIMRDVYSYIPVCVSQLNRNLNDPKFFSSGRSFEPTIDDLKESGNPGEASDIVLSLFEPIRFRTEDPVYKVKKFVDESTGGNYFRRVKVLKNTYGEDSVGLGMAFYGVIGEFKELPRKDHMENFDYESVFNGIYFLEK